MRLTLDTSILVYAASANDERNATALSLVERAGRADCIQTLQSFGECFRVLTVRQRWPAENAIRAISGYLDTFTVVAAAAEDLAAAMTAVRDHKLSFWDSMLWATARRAGCRLILSEDQQNGRSLGGVRFVNPFRPENAPILDLALPPEEPSP
jgi:predicted nucleic acid-binding protein